MRVHASCVVFCSYSNKVLYLQLIHKTVRTPRNRSTLESSLLVHRISGFWKLDGPTIFDNRSGEGTCKLCFVLLLMLWLQLIHRTFSTPRSRKTHESNLLVHKISSFWKLDGPMIFDMHATDRVREHASCVLFCCCSNS